MTMIFNEYFCIFYRSSTYYYFIDLHRVSAAKAEADKKPESPKAEPEKMDVDMDEL